MRYDDKLMIMPEQLTLAPSICRLAGEVLSIGRRVMQKGVVIAERTVYTLTDLTGGHVTQLSEYSDDNR